MNLSELLEALATPDDAQRAAALVRKPITESRDQLVRWLDIAVRLGSIVEGGASGLFSALGEVEQSAGATDVEDIREMRAEIARLESELASTKTSNDERIIAAATRRELTAERARQLAELEATAARVSTLERGARTIHALAGDRT